MLGYASDIWLDIKQSNLYQMVPVPFLGSYCKAIAFKSVKCKSTLTIFLKCHIYKTLLYSLKFACHLSIKSLRH